MEDGVVVITTFAQQQEIFTCFRSHIAMKFNIQFTEIGVETLLENEGKRNNAGVDKKKKNNASNIPRIPFYLST
jgi:hypothetical protein